MKLTKFILFGLLIGITASSSYSQIRPKIKDIIDEFGQTAYAYFLSANRPGYGADAYVTEKGKVQVTTGISFNDEIFEIPLGLSYGVSKKFELSAGISAYTSSYNFIGDKIGGIGDSYIGAKYRFQESAYFMHSVQGIVKIPTASKQTELGTGRTDFHFGIAEAFYEKNFGYDLSLEMNFLHRRDYPPDRKYPDILRNLVDSLKQVYSYNFETEFVISGGPSYDISDTFSFYAGFSFSRNLKLDYNNTQFYAGFGYLIANRVNFGFGGSFDPSNSSNWIISSILNISL